MVLLFQSNWMEATAFCKSNGGALASIRSQEENDQAVESILRSRKYLFIVVALVIEFNPKFDYRLFSVSTI